MSESETSSTREAEIDRIRKHYLKLRQLMLKDGRIDREEQEILDRVASKIARVEERFAGDETGSERTGGAEPSGAGETSPPATSISGSVGKGGKNHENDVRTVQQLLNQNGASTTLQVDGLAGPKTAGAISKFQQNNLGFQDGRIDPDGQTWGALSGGEGGSQGAQPEGSGEAAGGSGGTEGDGGENQTPGHIPETAGGGLIEPPETPEEMERQIKKQIDEQIPDEVIVIISENDEDDDVLASPEVPFVRNQEISVGCPFGEIKIKFNDQGQVESAAVAKPIIPGASVGAGAYGVFAKVEAKPYSGALKLSKKGGNLKLEFELSASGSGMMGLGVAKGDAWAGIGVDIEVKVSRTQTITAELALETLKEMAMSPTPLPMPPATFSLPAEIVLSGEQSLVFGGSAPKGVISAADKIVLKDYNPMATLKVFEANGQLDCEFKSYDGLTQMAEDVGRQMVPILDMYFQAMELADELARLMEDPDAYTEEKRKELEDIKRKLAALPDDLSDFVDDELKKLDKFEEEVGEQLDEWGDAIDDAYDQVKEAVEEELEDTKEALEDAYDTAEELYNEAEEAVDDMEKAVAETVADVEDAVEETLADVEDAVEETIDDVEDAVNEAIDDVEEAVEETIDNVEDAVEEAMDEAEEAVDETIENVEEAIGDAEEAVEETLEDVEEAFDDAEEAVDEALDDAEEYIDEKTDEFLDDVADIFK